MQYPSGAIIQNYNVTAGRVIQLPCRYDQQEPSDGFRAIIFSGAVISTQNGGVFPNQAGPAFAGGKPACLDFDLTQILQQNTLSMIRSITIATTGVTGTNGSNVVLRLNSGAAFPLLPLTAGSSAAAGMFLSQDFCSADPIFSLQAGAGSASGFWNFVVTVTNYKTDGFGVPICLDPLFSAGV